MPVAYYYAGPGRFLTMLLDGGGIGAIVVPLVALIVFAAALLALAVTRFRRVLLAGG